jgi:hypothetical protein
LKLAGLWIRAVVAQIQKCVSQLTELWKRTTGSRTAKTPDRGCSRP